MKKETMATLRYESPQVTTIQLIAEQAMLAGSSNLDDMHETEGEWA